MRRIFVVNEPLTFDSTTNEWVRAVNLDPAKDHGQLIYMLPAGQLPNDIRPIVEQLREKMADYGPDDAILLIGDPRAMAVASALASRAGNGKFNLLHWQRRQRRYDLIEVELAA